MSKVEKIPWARPSYWGNERRYVTEALDSSWISGGPFVDRLEHDFANHCKVSAATSCANGTAAIHLAYLALGLKPGDEIVVPAFGFLAAANIALLMNVKPVFCDVDPETWCARAEDVEPLLTKHTRAVVAVHTYGNVCELDELSALSQAYAIPLIEDAAEAFGSQYKGRAAGIIGTVGTFSFHATKTITTGEGGMVLALDEDLRHRMELFRSHGLLRKQHYWHELPGHNFRLTNLQAALGCAQLEKIDIIRKERNRVYEHYRARLSGVEGISLQMVHKHVDPLMWAMAVRLNMRIYSQGRDAVIDQMNEAGIETRPGFYPPDALSYFGPSKVPGSSRLAAEIICLPCFPSLTDAKIDRVCDVLQRCKNLQ